MIVAALFATACIFAASGQAFAACLISLAAIAVAGRRRAIA